MGALFVFAVNSFWLGNGWAGGPTEDSGIVLLVILLVAIFTAAVYLRNALIALFVKKRLVVLEIGKGPFRVGDDVDFTLTFKDNGRPVQNTTLFLVSEEAGGERVLTTDRKGRASFVSGREAIYHVSLSNFLVHGSDRIIVNKRD